MRKTTGVLYSWRWTALDDHVAELDKAMELITDGPDCGDPTCPVHGDGNISDEDDDEPRVVH